MRKRYGSAGKPNTTVGGAYKAQKSIIDMAQAVPMSGHVG